MHKNSARRPRCLKRSAKLLTMASTSQIFLSALKGIVGNRLKNCHWSSNLHTEYHRIVLYQLASSFIYDYMNSYFI